MSELKNFQPSESWRANFKKYLFLERKPTEVAIDLIDEPKRYSLDVREDLKNILEQKIHKRTGFEEISSKLNTMEKSFNICNETVFNDDEEAAAAASWQRTSDESFEVMERMCNKTASDPDSTLFRYLNSKEKDEVVADLKKRSENGNSQEIDPLNHLLHEFRLNDRKELEDNKCISSSMDCTQLEDIEAPSRLWENTVNGDSMLPSSPVKMIGLLRPSTIIEECAEESVSTDVSSHPTTQGTLKGYSSDVSGSSYNTAQTSTSTTTSANTSGAKDDEGAIDVDQLFWSAIKKSRDQLLSGKEHLIADMELTKPEGMHSALSTNKEEPDVVDNSKDLIDLEGTLGPLHKSPHSSFLDGTVVEKDNGASVEKAAEEERLAKIQPDLDDSVIEVFSDEDEEGSDENKYENLANIKLPLPSEGMEGWNDESLNDTTIDENKENCIRENAEKSMEFDDTMEEVEYLLKVGMEYMAAEAAIATKNKASESGGDTQRQPLKPSSKQNTFLLPLTPSPMPNRQKDFNSNSGTKAKITKTPAKSTEKSKPVNRFALDMKPIPKLDVFAKSTHPIHPRHKELSSKAQFSHIVSPIGTYMKKTVTTPLMATMKAKPQTDVKNSAALRELEHESRLYQPRFGYGPNVVNERARQALNTNGERKVLPKKAYIASELKHIVDERTPIKIPGGKKIQKYLESAMVPAVLRHDGKLKIPGGICKTNIPSASLAAKTDTSGPRRDNKSLADLSVMSGDVSMYTMMDAQKF